MNELWRRLRNLIHRRAFERDLDEELRFHLDMKARESDHYSARRQFGNVARIKETSREVWGWTSLERLVQDLRYALRMMRRSPGFTSVAVLSLALGIGANTAIFTLADNVMLRMLPVRNPEQLLMFARAMPNGVGRSRIRDSFRFAITAPLFRSLLRFLARRRRSLQTRTARSNRPPRNLCPESSSTFLGSKPSSGVLSRARMIVFPAHLRSL